MAFPFPVATQAGFCDTFSFARWHLPPLLLVAGAGGIYKEASLDFLENKDLDQIKEYDNSLF